MAIIVPSHQIDLFTSELFPLSPSLHAPSPSPQVGLVNHVDAPLREGKGVSKTETRFQRSLPARSPDRRQRPFLARSQVISVPGLVRRNVKKELYVPKGWLGLEGPVRTHATQCMQIERLPTSFLI